MGPEHPALEAVFMALRVEFLLRQVADEEERRALLAEVLPHAADLAEALYESGEMERLCAREATAAEMVRKLAALLPPARQDVPL